MEHGPTNISTGGTGVISAPRGLSVCMEGPLNHEAEALQLLFAEPSAQCLPTGISCCVNPREAPAGEEHSAPEVSIQVLL